MFFLMLDDALVVFIGSISSITGGHSGSTNFAKSTNRKLRCVLYDVLNNTHLVIGDSRTSIPSQFTQTSSYLTVFTTVPAFFDFAPRITETFAQVFTDSTTILFADNTVKVKPFSNITG